MKIVKNFIVVAGLTLLLVLAPLLGPGFRVSEPVNPVSAGVPAKQLVVEQKPEQASDGLRAQGYLLRGEYLQAESLLSGKLLSPNSAVLLIKAKLSLGQDNEALYLINRYRFNPMAAAMYGLYLADQGDYQNAWKNLTPYREQRTVDKLEMQLYLCQILLKQGQPLQAAQILQILDSTRGEVLLVKGDLALVQRDYYRAWDLYRQVLDKGYFTADSNFLAKTAITAIAAGQDWVYLADKIRRQDAQSGLADYVAAQACLHTGDLVAAQAKLQSALHLRLPGRLYESAVTLSNELTARTAAERAVQTVVNLGGI